MLEDRGHSYPAQNITVVEFPSEEKGLKSLFPSPKGMVESNWPPIQLAYLSHYLAKLGCKSIVIEDHYVDRDYIDDLALFYSRSLRGYPNHCYRLHFFTEQMTQEKWHEIIVETDNIKRTSNTKNLQTGYLGFTVARPLAGVPIGRTVLKTFPSSAETGEIRSFGSIRKYDVYLAGMEFQVSGLAFQQQDQGVSACATIALWSALHRIAAVESLEISTPADITEAASRYLVHGGRALPSGGLDIGQICEATRAAGLEPLLIRSTSLENDRAQIYSYVQSGFPPVLAIQGLNKEGEFLSSGHAICAVGVKLGEILPQTETAFQFRDAATAVKGIYIHDDRLGPYAITELGAHTYTRNGATNVFTSITIKWPGNDVVETEKSVLKAIIVPVPKKLRLTITRMRELGLSIAQFSATVLPQFKDKVTLNCIFKQGKEYQKNAPQYGLSSNGLYKLLCGIALSRYIGVIEIGVPDGPLFDVIVDATETQANPSVLACVKREAWPVTEQKLLQVMSENLGSNLIF